MRRLVLGRSRGGWAGKMITLGYASPVGVALEMSMPEVEAHCREQIETFRAAEAGFLLATGCEYPSEAPLDGAVAMRVASEKAGPGWRAKG